MQGVNNNNDRQPPIRDEVVKNKSSNTCQKIGNDTGLRYINVNFHHISTDKLLVCAFLVKGFQ